MANIKDLRAQVEQEDKANSASPPSAPGASNATIQDSFGRTWVTVDTLADLVIKLVNIDGTLTSDFETKVNALIDTKLSETMAVVFDDNSTGDYKVGK